MDKPQSAWRELAMALSLANLAFLRIWSETLTYTRPDTYVMHEPPGPAAYAAVILNVLWMGGAIWGVFRLAERWPRGALVKRWVLLVLLLLPLNGLRAVLAGRLPYLKSDLLLLLGPRGVVLLAAGLALVAALVLALWSRQLAGAAAAVLLLLSPFVAITFAQGLWRAAHSSAAGFSPGAPAPPLAAAARTSPRVLWVIFDEWDYRLSFVDRARGLALPEIDRFRSEALETTHADSPGPETTISMPAITLDKPVASFRQVGPGKLLVTVRGEAAPLDWGRQPNLFSKARALGFRTAVLGWYQPYCRVMNWSLDACQWWEMPVQYNSMGRGLGTVMAHQARSLFETTLLSPFGQSLAVRYQAQSYREMLAAALPLVARTDYGLALVHLPIPHAPHAWDRRTGGFTLANSPIRGYNDSLALTDRTVGELRRAMERAGTFDSTTILLTSDHPYRAASALDGRSDTRVPFLLKLAGHREGRVFPEKLNTLATHGLILGILGGQVKTPAEAAGWLGNYARRGSNSTGASAP